MEVGKVNLLGNMAVGGLSYGVMGSWDIFVLSESGEERGKEGKGLRQNGYGLGRLENAVCFSSVRICSEGQD